MSSDRDLRDYIPFGGTASSMSSSGRRSAVQTRATRKNAEARQKRLTELRLERLKVECELEITKLELDIMERTIHSEVCDDEETDSHHRISVPLQDQDDGSSLNTIPYNTSAYVHLPATYEETRVQQLSDNNVNPHSDIRWHPPRPHQPGSTPLDHENPAVAEEANSETPSRDTVPTTSHDTVPATSHVSYAEPRVLPSAAQPAEANIHAPTWIPNQPGYMSTPSAVPQSNIHPPVSTPYNGITSNSRNSENVNPHSDIRWHPPGPHEPGIASTPLDHGNSAVAERADFEVPSRDAVPATSHESYAEPHVLLPAARPAGANVHAPAWIPGQPGYMSTPSAVPQPNIHPHVSTPYNGMRSYKQNSENNISYTPHVADLSSADPELSNRNVRNMIMDREHDSTDVYEKMAAAMRDSIALPKPELLTFNGSPRMYMQFMRNFECNIANRVPDYRLKLQYLIQYWNAEVQNYISSCIMMEPNEGYNKALEILATRYGNHHAIQKSYLKKVLDGAQLRPSDYKGLSDLAHDMQQCSIALKLLGYKCDLDSGETMLKISRRFPTHVRARWIRESSNIIDRYNRDPTFEEMTWYILGEARTANTMYGQDFYHEATARVSMKHADNSGTKIKATTLVTRNVAGGSEHKQSMCAVCNEDQHPIWKCDTFIKMCLHDRKELVKTNKWCSNCFSKRHVVTECQHGKKLCNRRECKDMHKHNTLVCSSIIAQDDNTKPEGNVLSTTQTGKNIYLRVVPVCVFGSNGTEISTYALLDDCADITLITKSLRNKLQLTGKKKTLSLSTVNKSNGAVQSEQLDVNVSSIDKQSKLQLGGAYVVDSLPVSKSSIATIEDIGNWPHLQNIDLPKPTNKEVTILISSAHPEAFYVYEQKKAQPGMPYASKSLLGWSVIGPASRDARGDGCINLVTNETLEEQLQRLWNTEFNDVNAYTTQRTSSIEDSRALKVMKDTVTLVDGHQTIGLPWRSTPPPLYDNRIMAANRADMLMKRLQKNPELKDSYCATINGYIAKGYAYKVTNAEENNIIPRYYLPHHPVFHPQKKKLRVVFDAAAKYRGQSLNGMLLQGPDLTNNLIGVLQRFRKYNIALSADIQEMFMQGKVNKRDSNALRFLWWKDHDFTKAPIDYAMTTHTFGLNSSPSVCNFALRHTADQHKDKYRNETISTVHDSFYVDDLLTSVANIEDANMLVKEVTELLSLGGFNLTKWVSNSREVMHEIDEKQRAELTEIPTISYLRDIGNQR